MEDFHEYFSSETIKKLEILSGDLQNADAFSDAERLELFRALHTVKGSSQTFGFTRTGVLAHRLENTLSTAQNKKFLSDQTIKNLFVEGIALLIKSLQEKHFETPASFVEKINAIAPDSAEEKKITETPLPEIPSEISSQLSAQEKNALSSALDAGKTLYGLEVDFDLTNFAGEFKTFREILSKSGEIIATLPSPKFNAAGKIGFQIIFASLLPTAQIRKTTEKSAARIIFDTSEKTFTADLQGILSQVAKHGQSVAERFGKRIEFEVSADETELSAERLKLIFDVLIHLTRNAVDHAIESEGKIQINLKTEEQNLVLSISDDGRGIDLEKVKAKACERNLISAEQSLTEQETLDLIFLPELSTASKLTEISGRGIGLDAVKNAVEKAHGKINVNSRSGQGTTFEIFLPRDEE